jgi:5-hydroxyisourate hydrolase
MSTISTHVLDVVLGKPATRVAVRLEKLVENAWVKRCESATDEEGRCRELTHGELPGTYRLTFRTDAYFARSGRTSIYPEISITFICGREDHYHLPLLLSENGYTTYRGS